MERLKQQLQAEGIAYRADEPLAAHCTFKIGGPADVFALPETEEQLCHVIALCKEQGVKYYLLGNGSNILFEDDCFVEKRNESKNTKWLLTQAAMIEMYARLAKIK